MTATDELKMLLEQRGERYVENGFGITWRYLSDPHTATESMDGTLIVTGLTPKQAIAATLGAGACRNIAPSYLDFLCSECGFVYYRNDENYIGGGNDWRYCPSCGAMVVDE